MPGKFELKKAKNGKLFFNLLATNGQVILTSQMYASKATAKKGIASVQNNAAEPGQFERLTTKKGEPYFVLKAKNRQVIGTSESYNTAKAMENGIASVGKNAPGAAIEDQSAG